jgi:hypothetical protein
MLSPQNLAVKRLRSERARSLNPPADVQWYRRTSLSISIFQTASVTSTARSSAGQATSRSPPPGPRADLRARKRADSGVAPKTAAQVMLRAVTLIPARAGS